MLHGQEIFFSMCINFEEYPMRMDEKINFIIDKKKACVNMISFIQRRQERVNISQEMYIIK